MTEGAGRESRPLMLTYPMSARDESISNADFGRLRSLIYAQSGINLNAEKKTMLELRIKRRLRSLNLNSFGQYCDYLFGPHGRKGGNGSFTRRGHYQQDRFLSRAGAF